MCKEEFSLPLFNCQYKACLKALNMFFKDESTKIQWMLTINPFLGNISPIDMLKVGRFDKLINFIYTQLEEGKRDA